MIGVNLLLSTPCQMDDGESIWLILVTEQHIILVLAICHRFDYAPEQQMVWRKLALKLRTKALRDGSVGTIPAPFFQ